MINKHLISFFCLVSEYLKELHLRLLRRALKSAQSNRWERCMIKFCHQQGYHQEAWEIERFTYKKASTQVKLKVLKVFLNLICVLLCIFPDFKYIWYKNDNSTTSILLNPTLYAGIYINLLSNVYISLIFTIIKP